MTPKEAIDVIRSNYPITGYSILQEALNVAIKALQEKADSEIEHKTLIEGLEARMHAPKKEEQP